jgi:hypothetical protein
MEYDLLTSILVMVCPDARNFCSGRMKSNGVREGYTIAIVDGRSLGVDSHKRALKKKIK